MIDDRQGIDTEHSSSHGPGMLHAESPSQPPAPVTWEEYIALPEDDLRELIDGVLVEVEVPTKLHEWIVAELLFALKLWSRDHGGIVFASGYKVRIDRSPARGSAFMPDIQLFRSPETIAGPEHDQGLSDGAPDLVVEIISPSSGRHDRVTKFNGYAAIACPEYWLIDPDSRLLEQFVLEDGHYRLAARPAEDALFEPKTFPGLSIPLKSLWTVPRSSTPPAAD